MRPAADVIVVGSGGGGGVVAARLAQAGMRVLVLEEGPWATATDFNQRDRDMYDLLFRGRGAQETEDNSISVLQGRCVGGSTVINQGDVTGIPDELFELWNRRYQLEGITPDQLQPSIDRVRQMIGAGPIEDHNVNRNNALLLEGANKLGYAGGRFEDNRVGCIGSGYCHLGCSYDAKRSVLITYIPEALKHGVTVKPFHRVEKVLHRRSQVIGVEAVELDRDGNEVARHELKAPNVFVCAGAIHTPLILQRSGLGGRHVGRNLSLQPQGAVVARFPERLKSYRGIPQSTYVDEFETVSTADGFTGFRIEGVFQPPGTASAFLPGLGKQMMDLLTRYDQLAACLVLVPDQPSGRVTPWGSRLFPRISYTPDRDWFDVLRQGMATAARIYLAAGAEEVWFPVTGSGSVKTEGDIDRVTADLQLLPTAVRLISAHPQGTARMSDNRRLGVVDSMFSVHGTDGLYVADASVFPTTASSHTMLPVMSMADLAATRFLSRN